MILSRCTLIWLCCSLSSLGQMTFAENIESGECSHCCQCDQCHGVSLDPGHPGKPRREKPGDINRADCPPGRYLKYDHSRSGNPSRVAPWATCSVNKKYSGSFVGGGAPFANVPQSKISLLGRGRNRKANGCGQHGEGTWGLDYSGYFGKANVWLKYTQDRNQGGEGAYATDGEPKLISKLKSLVH